jgi:hypothetical protein
MSNGKPVEHGDARAAKARAAGEDDIAELKRAQPRWGMEGRSDAA